ncbi:MAG: sugar-binding transcriptional regulator [Alphaproteobacteria bacterium]
MSSTSEKRSTTVADASARVGVYGYNPVVRAAWLYYQDGMTQSDIADILGVSRTTVVNYLQEARDLGVVTIRVSHDVVASVRLAQELRDKFGLADAVVVPDGRRGDAKGATARIADAGGDYLLELLREGGILGVSWGRTVRALSETIPKASIANLTVCQVVGSTRSNDWLWAEQCSMSIAARLGGICLNMHAPAVVSRPEIRDLLLREPVIAEQFAIVQKCDVVCFGVCSLAADSLIMDAGLVTPDECREFVRQGAVGVICGRFYDAAGKAFTSDYDRRLLAMSLDEISQVKTRLAVAGGEEKIQAILGALRAKYMNILVTDAATAQGLLEAKNP